MFADLFGDTGADYMLRASVYLIFTSRLPKVYQKGLQSPAAQGLGAFPYFRVSTGCLPAKLFYGETDLFSDFLPLSATKNPVQGS